MRKQVPNTLKHGRIRKGPMGSTDKDGLMGAFMFELDGIAYRVMSSGPDNGGWEHVSVSVYDRHQERERTPTWDEMCIIKNYFWGEEECVIQYHPPRSQYVDCHPNVLHLWKPCDQDIPMPPTIYV